MIRADHQRLRARQPGGQPTEDVIVREVRADDLEVLLSDESLETNNIQRIVSKGKMMIKPELIRGVDLSCLCQSRYAFRGIRRGRTICEGDIMPPLLKLRAKCYHGFGWAGQLPVAQKVKNFQGWFGWLTLRRAFVFGRLPATKLASWLAAAYDNKLLEIGRNPSGLPGLVR